MIVTSGYNVYPSRIEDIIDKCPDVNYCCVIGVKDPYKMQKIRFQLYKTVYLDGRVEYEDFSTSYCVDKNGGASYTNTFIQQEALKALSEQGIEDYCVKFPYLPNRYKLEIVTEDCMYDKTQKGDYDTIGILYANVPQRGKVNINRFYKETENGFEPISKEEYDMRTSAANNDL